MIFSFDVQVLKGDCGLLEVFVDKSIVLLYDNINY